MTGSGSRSRDAGHPLVLGVMVKERGARPAPRFAVAGGVYRLGQERADWTSVDINEGGLYVKGAMLYPHNSVHDLQLNLPARAGEIELLCRARVAWTNGPESRTKPELPVGMGLQFLDLDAQTRSLIRRYVGELRHAAPQVTPRSIERYLEEFDALCRADPQTGPTLPGGGARKALQACSEGPLHSALASSVEWSETPLSSEPTRRGPSGNPAAMIEARPEAGPARADPSVLELVQQTRSPSNSLTEGVLPAGTVLGSYRVIKLVGSGSMGDVYLARHRRLGRLVALKRLRADAATNPGAVRRFFQEAQRISQLNHPNIVEVIDLVEQGDERCYVMEWLPGQSLCRWRGQGEAMSITRALTVSSQLCDALEVLHGQGIVHRDLKPENVILIERGGEPDVVKLLDFSVSKFVNRATGESRLNTQTGMVLGTPGYLAPEQIVGMDIDHRCDLYALGVVMYQLLTGSKPFVADSWPQLLFMHTTKRPRPPSELTPHALPPALDALIMQCLEKDPERRPESAAEVRARLQAVTQSLFDDDQASISPLAETPASRWSPGRVISIVALSWFCIALVALLWALLR